MKIELENFFFRICFLVTNIERFVPNSFIINTNFICSPFCDSKFCHAWCDFLYLLSLSPKIKIFFFNGYMDTKNVTSQVSRKNNIKSLSYRSYQTNTIPSRQVQGMETRSIVKAAATVVVRWTMTPLSKLLNLKQKVSCQMDEAQSPKSFKV